MLLFWQLIGVYLLLYTNSLLYNNHNNSVTKFVVYTINKFIKKTNINLYVTNNK